jgi:hypothetical protein
MKKPGHLSSGSVVEKRDTLMARVGRMNLVPMRMILPNSLMTMNSLVSSTRFMPVTSPILRAVFKTNSQNGNPSKINPEKVACFSSPNPDHQLPSFHQQSTTTSPQKNHVQPHVFSKTPSKNKVPPPPEKYCRSAPLRAGFLASSGDDDGGHFVLASKVEGLGAAQPAQTSPTTENDLVCLVSGESRAFPFGNRALFV